MPYELNTQARLYDETLGVNEIVYVSKIVSHLDAPDKDTLDISNETISLNGKTFDTILGRITKLADLVDQKNSIFSRAKAIDREGNIHMDRLEGAIDVLKTRLLSTGSSWYTDDDGNLMFESVNGKAAMMLCGEGFMIAYGKDDTGAWNWRTFGTGEGFTADALITGYLSADRIEAGSLTISKLSEDIGQHLDLSANPYIAANRGVASIAEEYYPSVSRTEPEGGAWQDTVPEWQPGMFIWTRTRITFTDGDETLTEPVCATGQDGAEALTLSIETPGGTAFLFGAGELTLTAIGRRGAEPLTGVVFAWQRLEDGDWVTVDPEDISGDDGETLTVSGASVALLGIYRCDMDYAGQVLSAAVTVTNKTDPVVSPAMPDSPVVNMLWIDTSVTPDALMRYDGFNWLPVTVPYEMIAAHAADISALKDSISMTVSRTEYLQALSEKADTTDLDAKPDRTEVEARLSELTMTADEIALRVLTAQNAVDELEQDVAVFGTIVMVDAGGLKLRQPQSKNGIDIADGAVAIVDEHNKQVAVMSEGESRFPVVKVEERMTVGGYVTIVLPDGGSITQWETGWVGK